MFTNKLNLRATVDQMRQSAPQKHMENALRSSNASLTSSVSAINNRTPVISGTGQVTLVKNVNDTVVPFSTFNDFARMGFYNLVGQGTPDDSDCEALVTAFMAGQNLTLKTVDVTVGGEMEKRTEINFNMYGTLSEAVQRLNTSPVSSSIDSGRVFDIVQLPFSVVNGLAVIAVRTATSDSLVLKDLKSSVKINYSTAYKIFIGRCKTTLTDAYTPFGDLGSQAVKFFVDEKETLTINTQS